MSPLILPPQDYDNNDRTTRYAQCFTFASLFGRQLGANPIVRNPYTYTHIYNSRSFVRALARESTCHPVW
ncbi:hypothetical protein ZHAS_00007865 [Anopheles sinensis]|uniref:Uncharacterized protein n=1 Tax=Anopheles sinensis TaxID=74873 RepID=A0A084VQZ7_ANOSI|nr:hypothetical protein ZHAS_00007865 [Anopheles sinensis]